MSIMKTLSEIYSIECLIQYVKRSTKCKTADDEEQIQSLKFIS